MHLEILQFLTVLFVDDKVQVDSNGFVHSFQIDLQNVQGPFKSVDVMFPFPEDLTDLLISTTLASSQGLGRFCPIPCKSELYKCVPHSWIEHKTCLLNLNYTIEYTKILWHRAPFPIGCHYMHWHRLLEPVFVCWTISIYLIYSEGTHPKKFPSFHQFQNQTFDPAPVHLSTLSDLHNQSDHTNHWLSLSFSKP